MVWTSGLVISVGDMGPCSFLTGVSTQKCYVETPLIVNHQPLASIESIGCEFETPSGEWRNSVPSKRWTLDEFGKQRAILRPWVTRGLVQKW